MASCTELPDRRKTKLLHLEKRGCRLQFGADLQTCGSFVDVPRQIRVKNFCSGVYSWCKLTHTVICQCVISSRIGRQRHTQAPHGSQGPRHCAQAPLHALGSRRCTQAPHHPLGPQHCPQAPRHPIGPRHHTQTSSTPPHHPAPNLPTLINKFYFDATYDAILISYFVICFLSGLFLLILSSQVYIF